MTDFIDARIPRPEDALLYRYANSVVLKFKNGHDAADAWGGAELRAGSAGCLVLPLARRGGGPAMTPQTYAEILAQTPAEILAALRADIEARADALRGITRAPDVLVDREAIRAQEGWG